MARFRLTFNHWDPVNAFVREHGALQWHAPQAVIALEHEGQIIAAAGFTDYIAGASISGHIIVASPHALTRGFLYTILHYPFEQLQVRRLSALIPSGNSAVKRFVEHLGFKFEAQLKHVYPDDDLLVYRLLREECQWVRVLGQPRNRLTPTSRPRPSTDFPPEPPSTTRH